jgi:hypothetical protein
VALLAGDGEAGALDGLGLGKGLVVDRVTHAAGLVRVPARVDGRRGADLPGMTLGAVFDLRHERLTTLRQELVAGRAVVRVHLLEGDLQVAMAFAAHLVRRDELVHARAVAGDAVDLVVDGVNLVSDGGLDLLPLRVVREMAAGADLTRNLGFLLHPIPRVRRGEVELPEVVDHVAGVARVAVHVLVTALGPPLERVFHQVARRAERGIVLDVVVDPPPGITRAGHHDHGDDGDDLPVAKQEGDDLRESLAEAQRAPPWHSRQGFLPLSPLGLRPSWGEPPGRPTA